MAAHTDITHRCTSSCPVSKCASCVVGYQKRGQKMWWNYMRKKLIATHRIFILYVSMIPWWLSYSASATLKNELFVKRASSSIYILVTWDGPAHSTIERKKLKFFSGTLRYFASLKFDLVTSPGSILYRFNETWEP